MMLEKPISESRKDNCVPNWARSCFKEAVRAALCELDDDAARLLSKSREWMRIAINEDMAERGPGCDAAHRYEVIAFADWLRNDTFDNDLLVSACDHLNRYLLTTTDKVAFSEALPSFVVARRFEDVVRHFDACAKLKRPTNLNRIRCPGRMSLVIAENKLSGKPMGSELGRAFERFLRFKIPCCLRVGEGQGYGTPDDLPTYAYMLRDLFDPALPTGIPLLRELLRFVPTEWPSE